MVFNILMTRYWKLIILLDPTCFISEIYIIFCVNEIIHFGWLKLRIFMGLCKLYSNKKYLKFIGKYFILTIWHQTNIILFTYDRFFNKKRNKINC